MTTRLFVEARIALARRMQTLREQREAGMVSAEYAVGILAAVAFALVLLAVMRSDAVRGAVNGIVQDALTVS